MEMRVELKVRSGASRSTIRVEYDRRSEQPVITPHHPVPALPRAVHDSLYIGVDPRVRIHHSFMSTLRLMTSYHAVFAKVSEGRAA